MRALADALGVIAGFLVCFRFFYHHAVARRRRPPHDDVLEHIRQREAENKEIDAILAPRIRDREGKN